MRQTRKPLCFVMLMLTANCMARPNVEADYVFENVNVIPMNAEHVLENRAVAVRGNGIVAIVDQASAADILAERRIDGAGRYLMPGLADMHVHVRWTPQAMFNLFLANGVTTVVNMGLRDGNGAIDHIKLRDDIAAARLSGPRYLTSGHQLTSQHLPTVADVAPVLDRHTEQQIDVLKVHGDLSPDVYDALIEGARERNLRITEHTQHLLPLAQSLRMDSIEHIEEFLYVSRDPAFGKSAAGSIDSFFRAYTSNLDALANAERRAAVVSDVAASSIYVSPSLIIYKYIQIYLADDLFSALRGCAADVSPQQHPRGVSGLADE